MEERYLGTPEVSAWTTVPEATLRFWRHRGDLGPPSFKLGPKRVVYKASDVLRWLEEQEQRAKGERTPAA